MPTDERITKAVLAAVDEVNQQLPGGVQIEKSLDAPLYGSSGKLESLDLDLDYGSRREDQRGIRHRHYHRRRKSFVEAKESFFYAGDVD